VNNFLKYSLCIDKKNLNAGVTLMLYKTGRVLFTYLFTRIGSDFCLPSAAVLTKTSSASLKSSRPAANRPIIYNRTPPINEMGLEHKKAVEMSWVGWTSTPRDL